MLEGILAELVAIAGEGGAPSPADSTAQTPLAVAADRCRSILRELRRAAGPRWAACIRAVAVAGAAPVIHVNRFLTRRATRPRTLLHCSARSRACAHSLCRLRHVTVRSELADLLLRPPSSSRAEAQPSSSRPAAVGDLPPAAAGAHSLALALALVDSMDTQDVLGIVRRALAPGGLSAALEREGGDAGTAQARAPAYDVAASCAAVVRALVARRPEAVGDAEALRATLVGDAFDLRRAPLCADLQYFAAAAHVTGRRCARAAMRCILHPSACLCPQRRRWSARRPPLCTEPLLSPSTAAERRRSSRPRRAGTARGA